MLTSAGPPAGNQAFEQPLAGKDIRNLLLLLYIFKVAGEGCHVNIWLSPQRAKLAPAQFTGISTLTPMLYLSFSTCAQTDAIIVEFS